jgi:hypothetical protein
MRWTIRPRLIDRIRLRGAARHYRAHGWDVAAAARPPRARPWRVPLGPVLLATGTAFDVLVVPAHLGLRVLALARSHNHVLGPARLPIRGPIAATPTGRWMFFVRAGDPLRPELADHPDVTHHGAGSWIPAPPSRLPAGPVRWMVSPAQTRWQLPDSYGVQALLVDALAEATPAAPAGAGPIGSLPTTT